jgi:threonine synthase
MQARIAQQEGFLLCPEGAATAAALAQEIESGRIHRQERVLLFNCATGLKYPMPHIDNRLDCTQPINYNDLVR